MTETAPYRLVDQLDRGWVNDGDRSRYRCFDPIAPHDRSSEVMDLEQVTAEAGPWRPVVAPAAADLAEFADALAAAGRRAVTSLAAALHLVSKRAYARAIARRLTEHDAWGYSRRTLIAGRPASWESDILLRIASFGHDLHEDPKKTASRVDVTARDRFAAVLDRWTTNADAYVEVADNLASVVSTHADDHHGTHGWTRIADQWLQPGRFAGSDFRACYRLLYSQSSYFDTHHI